MAYQDIHICISIISKTYHTIWYKIGSTLPPWTLETLAVIVFQVIPRSICV